MQDRQALRQRVEAARARLTRRPQTSLGIALLVIAGLVVAIFLLRQSDDPLPTAHIQADPFYLEANIVVFSPVSDEGGRQQQSTSTVRWWFASAAAWRWEIEISEEGSEQDTLLIGVTDGSKVWLYDDSSKTYQVVKAKEYPTVSLPISATIGLVPLGDLLEAWTNSGLTVQSSGQGQHVGRVADVYEYRPIWRYTDNAGEHAGGSGRIWVDGASGLIVRNVVDGGPTYTYLDARVTKLDLNPTFDASRFRFLPPDDAVEVPRD